MVDQTNIELMEDEEWSEHINQLLEGIDKILEENEEMTTGLDIATRLLRNDNQILQKEFEEFKESTVIRLDQEIENRTKAFEKIEELENKFNLLEEYTIKGINRDIRDFEYKTSISQERHDEIIAVHRNEIDNIKKDITAMQQIMNNYLMVNLDNPEYITKVHEKRGNHGTSNTKGEKPK